MAIKDHDTIREKFLGLLPTLRFRTDNWGELGTCLTIFKDLIDGLLDDQCICQRKIIDMAEANLFTTNKEINSLVTGSALEKYPDLASQNLHKRFFDEAIKQMTQNYEGYDHLKGFLQTNARTATVLTNAIKSHKTILEKFLELLPTFHCRTDRWNYNSVDIFKKVINKLLDEPSIAPKIINIVQKNVATINNSIVICFLEKYPDLASQDLYNRFFDDAIKQMTRDGEELYHISTYDTVKMLVKTIKNHETILEKFLELLPTFRCRTDKWNYKSTDIFKQIINKLLDEPSIRPKIIDVAQKNKDTIDTSVIDMIEKRYPGIF